MSRKLKEDLAEVRAVLETADSYIKDLALDEDSVTFSFVAPDKDPLPLTLFCADYPSSCTLYTDDGEPKEYSGRLTAVLDKIIAEHCKSLKIDPPASLAAARPIETQPEKPKGRPLKGSRGRMKKSTDGDSEEEEEEDFSDEDMDEHATEAGFETAERSELMIQDMDLFRSKFGKWALTTREFSDIDTIDLELHLNVDFLGSSVSDAWGVDREIPITCRLSMSPSLYVHATSPPKVEVFQNSPMKFGLKSQLTKIITDFVKSQWGQEDKGMRAVIDEDEVVQGKGKEKEKPSMLGSIGKGLSSMFGAKDVSPKDTTKDKDVAALMEMGFSLEQSINALKISADVSEALNLLLADPESCKDSAMKSRPKNTKRREPNTKKTRTDSSNPQAQWEEFEKLASDAKSRIPTREHGFLVQILDYLQIRIPTLSNYCVICDQPHVFANGAMLKPAVCSRELCCFAFQQLGVMSDAADDIATEAEVVDLLICMATAAANSSRCNDIFDPYPTIFDPADPKKLLLSPNSKDFERVKRVLTSFPAVQRLSQAKDCMEMKDQLDKADKLAYPFLQWLISSNRSHIVKLPKEKHLKSMVTPYQYVLLSSPPEKEEKFRQLKKEFGSVFAFHGSRVENWHCILRMGLKNASGTKLQLNGAAYGAGIYMSPQSATSFGYSQFHGGGGGGRKGWHNQGGDSGGGSDDRRFLNNSNFHCIALCEVINHSSIRKSGAIWVCPEADYVVTRFFFVYDQSHSGAAPTVQTSDSSFLREIETALQRN